MSRNRWHKTKVILDSKFCFGKYNGKTIKWLIDNDLQYIKWCLQEGVIKFDHERRPDKSKVAEEYYNSINNLNDIVTYE
jgi:hypothetical protein